MIHEYLYGPKREIRGIITRRSMIHMDIAKEKHFYRLQETTTATWPVIERLVQEQLKNNDVPELSTHLEVFLAKRRNKPLLRPYLTRLAYEAVGGSDWRSIAHVLAASELLNISTYQSNMCFDEKNADWQNTSASNQFIAAMISLSLAFHAIDAQPDLTQRQKAAAMAILAHSNEEVYVGQFLDINRLSLRSVRTYLEQLDVEFLKDYVHRCRLIGGSMITISLMGACAVDPDHAAIPILRRLFEAFGIGGQMLNDLADYIPAGERPYTAAYGDLLMGRLTYPTFILARASHGVTQIDNLKVNQNRTELCTSATSFLKDVNIARLVSQLIKAECWRDIQSSLGDLSDILPSEQISALSFIRYYMFENKILRYFIKARSVHMEGVL